MERRIITKGIILGLITLIVLLPSVPIVQSQSGIRVEFKVYGTNALGMELTHVTTIANAVLATPDKFDTDLSYTSRDAGAAWWCVTCYAHASKKNAVVGTYVVGEDTEWDQGSWNVNYDGENHVWLYARGNYDIKEKVYYDVNGVTNTVVDAIKNAINFIVDNLSKLL